MRKVPFLNFRLDTSISEGAAVLSHIEKARREDDARAGD
jgi:ribosome-binding factor A